MNSLGLRLGMVSFDSTDIDTVIVRKFEKGNSYSHLLDTIQHDQGNFIFRAQNDTLLMNVTLQSDYDYEVFLPSVNRTFRVSEINEPQTEGNCAGKVQCVNSVISSKLNSATIMIPIGNEILYLKK